MFHKFLTEKGMENEHELYELRRRVSFLEGTTLSVILAVLAFFSLMNVHLSLTIPRFERIFAEMLGDKPLPVATQLVLNYGRSGLALAVSVLLPLGTAIFLFLKRPGRIPWIFALGTIFFLIIQAIVICVALYLPMLSIISEMNSP